MLATRQRGCAAGHWLFVRSVPAAVAARMSSNCVQSVCPKGRQRKFPRTPAQSGRRQHRSTTAHTALRPYLFIFTTPPSGCRGAVAFRGCDFLGGVVRKIYALPSSAALCLLRHELRLTGSRTRDPAYTTAVSIWDTLTHRPPPQRTTRVIVFLCPACGNRWSAGESGAVKPA
jgi:hypothetical protein